MADYFYVSFAQYLSSGAFANTFDNQNVTATDGEGDSVFSLGDTFPAPNNDIEYRGQIVVDGTPLPVFQAGFGFGNYLIFSPRSLANTNFPASLTLPLSDTSDFTVCFAAGTEIETPDGAVTVEALKIGDLVVTDRGQAVPVKWVGRQTLLTRFSRCGSCLVRIRAGALGGGLPHDDLTVTADHGMVLDGYVINASALVNGDSIDWVPSAELPDTVTVYHVETEAHDVILANGAPSETFIDYRDRRAFDNFEEYLALYGAERIVPEMPMPRVSSARHLPAPLRHRLGLSVARGLARSA